MLAATLAARHSPKMSAQTLTMMRHAPLAVRASGRHAVRVHATATAAPADLKSTTVVLPRLQFAPRGRMTREVDGVTLTGTGLCCWPLPRGVTCRPP